MTTTTTFQAINVGSSPNDGSGDNLRSAFIKVNDNFNNLVDIGFDTGNINATGDVTIGNPNLGTGDLVINNRINIGNVLLTPLPYPTALINAVVDVDDFSQFNIQNVSEGTGCSADMVCSTSDADDTIGYVNMGINGQNYSDPAYWGISKPRDGYLYVAGGNLTIGTDEQSRGSPIGNDVRIHAGGLFAENIVATFSSSNVTVRANLVTGGAQINTGYQKYSPTANIAITANVNVSRIIITPTDIVVSYGANILLPNVTQDGTTITISSNVAVEHLAVYGQWLSSVSPGANTAISAGSSATYFYSSADVKWYKIG